MIKKVSVILLVLAMAFMLTGCDVPNIFSYWDGMTKNQTEKYICQELQEKYGEEFVVEKMYFTGGTWNTSGDLWAECSPKSDSGILFSIQTLVVGKSRIMRDDYIRNVVRNQIKNHIDDVLFDYYEIYATEVIVVGSNRFYDSKICLANLSTTKLFSESFVTNDSDDKNQTNICIILKNKDSNDIDKLKKAVQDMTSCFYSLNVAIDIFFADQETIDLCNKEANEKDTTHFQVIDFTYNSDFRRDRFIYDIKENGLTYIGTLLK